MHEFGSSMIRNQKQTNTTLAVPPLTLKKNRSKGGKGMAKSEQSSLRFGEENAGPPNKLSESELPRVLPRGRKKRGCSFQNVFGLQQEESKTLHRPGKDRLVFARRGGGLSAEKNRKKKLLK